MGHVCISWLYDITWYYMMHATGVSVSDRSQVVVNTFAFMTYWAFQPCCHYLRAVLYKRGYLLKIHWPKTKSFSNSFFFFLSPPPPPPRVMSHFMRIKENVAIHIFTSSSIPHEASNSLVNLANVTEKNVLLIQGCFLKFDFQYSAMCGC